MTFSEPGPINNSDFLCSHGQMLPLIKKLNINKQYALPYMLLNKSIWNFLKHFFGGGPSFIDFNECNICQQALDEVLKRKRYECKGFIKHKQKNLCFDYLATK